MTLNYSSPWTASYNYLPPASQPTANKNATQDAKNNAMVLLHNDGWEMKWTTSTLSWKEIKSGVHIPNSYTTTSTSWEPISYNTTIAFDPTEYTALFQMAKQKAKQLSDTIPNPTPEQRVGIHLQAVQDAIIHYTWATQEQAEKNMEALTQKALAQWEATIDWEKVQDNKAEICTSKWAIACYYLSLQCPEIDWKLHTTAQYAWWKDGHLDIQFSHKWNQYTYHPNSPVNGKPQIEKQ